MMRAAAEPYLLDECNTDPLVFVQEGHREKERFMRRWLAALRGSFALLGLAALLGLGGSAFGAPATAPAPKSAAPASYVLGPGDEIDVQVYGDQELSRTLMIKPDGTIALPLINEVHAAGKTTAQLETELVKMYSKYVKAPLVTVVVRQLRVDRIYLLGQVARPGDYQLRPNLNIFELLASAGGPTQRADLGKAVIIRGKTETIKLDLVEAFVKNQPPAINLQDGDTIYIPETDRNIVALGQVNRPGSYFLLEGQHLSDLLAATGGVTPKAGVTKAFLMRDNQQMQVDLKKVLDGDVAANVALKPGDMLVVPESKERIVVLGLVAKPGPYDLTENMTLIDAIAVAGGTTDKANLAGTQLIRIENGKPKATPLKADLVMQGKDVAGNVKLQDGDLLYIPQRGMNIWEILNTVGLFRGLFGF
jgi:polysaccharide biosynthesis/export protein